MRMMSKLRLLVLMLVAAVASVVAVNGNVVLASEAAAQAEAAPHDAHASHDTSVPLKWYNDTVIWTVVTFVLFLVILKTAAWGPLVDGLNKREAKYQKLVVDARHDRDAAIKMLAEYDQKLKTAHAKVDEIIAEARRDADTTKADIIATAQREAELTRHRALDEIARAKDQAINELFAHVRANVVAATERVLARTLNDSDHQRLVDEALAEVRRN